MNMHDARATGPATRSHAAAPTHDITGESLLGLEHRARAANISWGSVFAGVVTFLAVTVLLSLVTVGLGLGGAGAAAGIWSIVALALALLAAGFVAGSLAVRSGLLHGFLTWATSLVAALALTVLLGASALGALSGALGNIAGDAMARTTPSQVADEVDGSVDEEQVAEEAEEFAENAQETAQDAAWWGFAGLLLGAAIASFGGVLGVRSVLSRSVRTDRTVVETQY